MILKRFYSGLIIVFLLFLPFIIRELFFTETLDVVNLHKIAFCILFMFPFRYFIRYYVFRKNIISYLIYRHEWIIALVSQNDKKLYNRFLYALQFYEMQDYNKALSITKKLQKKYTNPSNLIALNYLEGLCYTAAKNTNKAISHFETMLENTPYDPVAYCFLALNHLTNQDYTNAKKACENAVFYGPENHLAYMCSALYSFKIADLPYALDFAQNALKLNATCSILYLIAGISTSMSGDNQKAKEYFITYFDKIKYEETADPRIHFRNTVKERHKKYLNIIKFPSLRQLLNNNDCVSGRY